MSTPTLLPRTAWTSHDPVHPLTLLYGPDVLGTACHWPGTTGPIGDSGLAATARRLEGYRAFHTAPPADGGRGWNDIAYNVAIDQGGRAFDLRGISHWSAANGSVATNRRWIAVLFLIGPGEQPTAAALDTFRWLRSQVILKAYPAATKVLGHVDVRPEPTACPGPLLEAHIKAGDLSRPWTAPAPKPAAPYRLKEYLRRGSTGPAVAAWQKRLNAEPGILDVRVDGDFGTVTEDATQDFQRKYHLTADGVVGPNTCIPAHWVWAGPGAKAA